MYSATIVLPSIDNKYTENVVSFIDNGCPIKGIQKLQKGELLVNDVGCFAVLRISWFLFLCLMFFVHTVHVSAVQGHKTISTIVEGKLSCLQRRGVVRKVGERH